MILRNSYLVRGLRAGLVVLLAGFGTAALGQPASIVLDADSSEFDRRNGRVVFTEVRVEQGNMVVTADRAESADIDFANSNWELSGNVRIRTGMGGIESSSARLTFRNHRLVTATALGGPARFERTVTDGAARKVTGSARKIEYNAAAGEVALTDQAVMRDGAREVSGGRLLYRMLEDRLIASTGQTGDERVRVVIEPPLEPGPTGEEETEPASPEDDGTEPR